MRIRSRGMSALMLTLVSVSGLSCADLHGNSDDGQVSTNEGALSYPAIPPFTIAVDSPPIAFLTNAKYQEVKNFNATLVFDNAGVDGIGPTDTALVYAKNNGLKMIVADSAHINPKAGPPLNSDIDALANHYKSNPTVEGYYIVDEPSATLFTELQNITRRFKADDPGHMTFVNLFPSEEGLAGEGVLDYGSEFVTSSQSLGQTFKTPPYMTKISTVQFGIDRSQWSAGEVLTLRLWNSPQKTSLYAQTSLSTPSDNWPMFPLNAGVLPNTSYYMEITHNGGGDHSVGPLSTSAPGEKFINDGTGYKNGIQTSWDLWFAFNQYNPAGTYDDYVCRWVSKSPDVLSFDYYPFNISGTVDDHYFENLEIIRMQAQRNGNAPFWSYIQSIGINNVLRVPNAPEMRYQIYSTLAYGAKGYIYFGYWTPSNPIFHDAIIQPNGTESPSYVWGKAINAEVLKLGPTLMTLTSQQVYQTGLTIPLNTLVLPATFFVQPNDGAARLSIGYFKSVGGRTYLMLFNRDTANSQTVLFMFNPKPAGVTEISKTTGTEVSTPYDPVTGFLNLTFAPGDGRLFALPVGYSG